MYWRDWHAEVFIFYFYSFRFWRKRWGVDAFKNSQPMKLLEGWKSGANWMFQCSSCHGNWIKYPIGQVLVNFSISVLQHVSYFISYTSLNYFVFHSLKSVHLHSFLKNSCLYHLIILISCEHAFMEFSEVIIEGQDAAKRQK